MASLNGFVALGVVDAHASSDVGKGRDGDVAPLGDGVPVPTPVEASQGTFTFG